MPSSLMFLLLWVLLFAFFLGVNIRLGVRFIRWVGRFLYVAREIRSPVEEEDLSAECSG